MPCPWRYAGRGPHCKDYRVHGHVRRAPFCIDLRSRVNPSSVGSRLGRRATGVSGRTGPQSMTTWSEDEQGIYEIKSYYHRVPPPASARGRGSQRPVQSPRILHSVPLDPLLSRPAWALVSSSCHNKARAWFLELSAGNPDTNLSAAGPSTYVQRTTKRQEHGAGSMHIHLSSKRAGPPEAFSMVKVISGKAP